MMQRPARKFKFADQSLAFRVRQRVWDSIVVFDKNHNHRFESQQIRQALVSILGQSQLQVQYVVNNVFRYDVDNDGAVTYTQFTNFCVEQHFGEMAIQRLHRREYYVNGGKRIMNLEEFQTTLDYCLEFIKSKGTHPQYAQLFREVDLDKDGYISYQDYFIFLREYFGSQSEAFEEEVKNPKPAPPKPVVVETQRITVVDGGTAYKQFARLIYTQFKVSTMQSDRNKNLILQRNEVEEILRNVLRLNGSNLSTMMQKCMHGTQSVKSVIVAYMTGTSVDQFSHQQKTLDEKQFIALASQSCHFVSIKPSESMLKICYKDATRGRSSLSISEYTNMMKNIFMNYEFDRRGLPIVK